MTEMLGYLGKAVLIGWVVCALVIAIIGNGKGCHAQ